jgi:subtilisin-like proprotein convertase family protein
MQGRVRRIGAGFVLAALGSAALTSHASADATVTFANPAAITIPDEGTASPYGSPINVTGQLGKIADINVTVNGFSHTFSSDVGMVLVGPGGQALSLMNAAGGDPDVTNATMIFDDQALKQVPVSTSWQTGTFRPTDYSPGEGFPPPGPGTGYVRSAPGGSATLDGIFGGTNPNGGWNLYVVDFGPQDSGSISGGWSIEINLDSTPPDTTISTGLQPG